MWHRNPDFVLENQRRWSVAIAMEELASHAQKCMVTWVKVVLYVQLSINAACKDSLCRQRSPQYTKNMGTLGKLQSYGPTHIVLGLSRQPCRRSD
jgi:hypothetical protein